MKELGERARVLLGRYKAVESLSSAHKERLLATLENAVARGTPSDFDDGQTLPLALPPDWPQRAWSTPLFRPLIAFLLMALPAVAAVGIVSRLTPAHVTQSPARVRPAAQGPLVPRLPVQAPGNDVSPAVAPVSPIAPRPPAARPSTSSSLPRIMHAPATDTTIDGEMRFLKDAQAAGADGNWHRALRLLDEYAARFPSGRLADVRAVAHLTALCQLGQTRLARSEAKRFLGRYPNSPFTDRVQRVCARAADP
jgi:hypothetical protein